MALIEIVTIDQGFGKKATIVTNKLFFEVILPTRSRLVLNLRQAEAFEKYLTKWIQEAKEFQEMKAELKEYLREKQEQEKEARGRTNHVG